MSEHVQEVDHITFELKERKTGHKLKRFNVMGVHNEMRYNDIEDQIMGKMKGKEITGTTVVMTIIIIVIVMVMIINVTSTITFIIITTISLITSFFYYYCICRFSCV